MNIFRSLSLTLLTASILTACSSGSDDSDDNGNSSGGGGGNQSVSYPINAPVLADVVGIWDTSAEDWEGDMDTQYLVIREDGRVIDYDYLNDEYEGDFAEDCYETWGSLDQTNMLQDLGSGEFQLVYPENIAFSQTIKMEVPSASELSFQRINEQWEDSNWIMTGDYTITVEVVNAGELKVTLETNSGASTLTLEGGESDNRDNYIWDVTSVDASDQHTIDEDLKLRLEEELNYFNTKMRTISKHNGKEEDFSPICGSVGFGKKISTFSRMRPQRK